MLLLYKCFFLLTYTLLILYIQSIIVAFDYFDVVKYFGYFCIIIGAVKNENILKADIITIR